MNLLHRFFLIITLVLIAAILEGISAWSIKKAYLSKNHKYLLISVVMFIMIIYLFYTVYHYEKISIVNAYYNAFSFLIITSIGIFFFREQLTKCEVVGVFLVFCGILMISLEELNKCFL